MCNQIGVWPSLQMDHLAVRMNLGNNMANAHMFFLSQLLFSQRCRKKAKRTQDETQHPTNVTTLPETEQTSFGNKTRNVEKTPNSDNDSFV